MKKTLTKAGIAGVMSLAALGALSASAMGMGHMSNVTPDEIATRQTTMFTEQASLIGASVDEVKEAWASGKDLRTLAQEKGITEEQMQTKMKAKRDEQMKTQLATLVSKGVITQAQADKRLATMQSQATTKKGEGKRGGKGIMSSLSF